MSNVRIKKATMVAIADAIRERTNSSSLFLPAQMPKEILSISNNDGWTDITPIITDSEDVLISAITMTEIANAIRAKTGKTDYLRPVEMPGEILGISFETSLYEPVLENNSWDSILDACENNRIPDTWKIDDTKSLDLGSEGIVNMQIVAMNADEKADGTGYAPITWVSEYLLKTSHRMNATNTTLGGWEKTEMRSYLKETVMPLIPDEVRRRIVEVKKYTRNYNDAGTLENNVASTEDVWIPSAREIFGGTSYETMGVIYDGVFTSTDTRKKMKVAATSATSWWVRSAYSTTYFRGVGSNGNYNNNLASTPIGVALGFCT